MIAYLHKWIFKEKNNLALGALSILVILITVCLERKFNVYWKFVYAISFFIIIICILGAYKVYYSKNKKFNRFLIVVLNIIILIDLYMYTIARTIGWFLWIKVILYLGLVIVCIHMIYIAKREFRQRFVKYLLLNIFTVIISFAGIYSSLYDMYFPYGYKNFIMDQKLNYARIVTSTDFIFYSSDCFFGRNVSYVKMPTPDYTEVQDDKNIAHSYPEMYDKVKFVYMIGRLFSMLEAVLFVVYISIIVLIMSSKYEEENEKSIKNQQNEIYERIIKMESDIEELKNIIKNNNFRTRELKGVEALKKLIKYFRN